MGCGLLVLCNFSQYYIDLTVSLMRCNFKVAESELRHATLTLKNLHVCILSYFLVSLRDGSNKVW